MASERDELRLEEYKLCQATTEKIESTIWKTSTIMGIGSIGPLIFFMTKNNNPDWQSVIIMGLLIFFSCIIWWFMASRWWDIQHTTFLRMRHLEEKLKFYQTRYIYYKDGKIKDIDLDDLPEEQLVQLKGGYKDKEDSNYKYKIDKRFCLRGVKKWLRLFPWFVLISWFGYGFHIWISSGDKKQLRFFNCPLVYIGFILVLFLALLFIYLIITKIRNKEALNEVKSRIKKNNTELNQK